MSGAKEGSGSGGGLSNHQYLSSPPPAPQRQTTTSSALYLSSAVAGGAVGGSSSGSSISSPTNSNHIASSSGGLQQQSQDSNLDYSPASSQWGAIGSSAAASNSSEDFFFQRDPLLLPRRNHTIGAGPTTSNRRRLNSHFQFPSQATTSPGQNSLSAITGGQDIDDDDWESMMKSRDKLVPDDVSGPRGREKERYAITHRINTQDEGDETATRGLDSGRTAAAPSAWHPDSSIFTTSHHRFSSQPSSAQAATPYYSGAQSPADSSDSRNGLGHQRSESAHVRSLEQGPFASASTVTSPSTHYSNVDMGMIRRHQSLNYATGRATANRLQASTRRSNEKQSGSYRSPVDFFDHPPSHQSISPGVPAIVSGRATPESTASLQPSSSIPSSDIQEAYARLSRMTLQPSYPIRESPIESNATANSNDAQRRLPSLVTNREMLERSAITSLQGSKSYGGPASAAANVPPIGHGHHRRDSASSTNAAQTKSDALRHDTSTTIQGPHSAMPASNSNTWKASHQVVVDPTWNKSAQPAPLDATALSIAMLQQRLLQQNPTPFQLSTAQQVQHQQALHNGMHSAAAMAYISGGQTGPLDLRQNASLPSIHHTFSAETVPPVFRGYPTVPFLGQPLAPLAAPAPTISPALASLIAARGYNPPSTQFDLNPARARFFVIKSFTEDDVQRSLKYEIWASTDKGNQRLDKAYKECQEEGNIPLYLFFSVNGSGHFCGMAQMMTALDYNSSSNVWVQEGKWKGTFKVKWIYVKDVPNVKLRHICLINTPERKPVTQSRDTQELPTDGGKKVLIIMAEYQSKTTLLQDWLFYEQQAIQQQQQRKDNGELLPPPPVTIDGLAST